MNAAEQLTLRDLRGCFDGAVPAVIATVSSDNTPNVTYLSRVRAVDENRVALSNQFFSKTARNLTENPRASVIVVDPATFDEFRLTLVYERTDRRGPVFERLRDDVDIVAALEGMQHIFKLRAADIYRVVHIEQICASGHRTPDTSGSPHPHDVADATAIAELTARLSRSSDLNTVLDAAVTGLAELFGYQHSVLFLLDEDGRRLYTIASHGFDAEGVGSELDLGEGVAGLAGERCRAVTVSSMSQIAKYSRSVRRSFEDSGAIGPGREIPLPGLSGVESILAVPAMALGQLMGVLMVESTQRAAFGAADEAVLTVVATIVASAVDAERARERRGDAGDVGTAAVPPTDPSARPTTVRFFAVDGSTFIDDDYLIKGVAGRILWSLLGHYTGTGRVEFTNRELRLDPALELPEFRDNFESRLILLKRRLDERASPIRIEKAGRGRFRLVVDTPLHMDRAEPRPRFTARRRGP